VPLPGHWCWSLDGERFEGTSPDREDALADARAELDPYGELAEGSVYLALVDKVPSAAEALIGAFDVELLFDNANEWLAHNELALEDSTIQVTAEAMAALVRGFHALVYRVCREHGVSCNWYLTNGDYELVQWTNDEEANACDR